MKPLRSLKDTRETHHRLDVAITHPNVISLEFSKKDIPWKDGKMVRVAPV